MSAIIVNNVSKAYKNYASRFARFCDWLLPWSTTRNTLSWVLREVSFTVQPGEALGIIGLNGAGKSTLLKIITGTTKPTTGSVHINGRVAALLELGIGFHPNFTGRQNVIMAGQLMGYGLQQITDLMEEIQRFAEIGEYLDKPVRVYSSGMQMRLAFSVATACRPDILIVDEALSIGDAYFQHKSFERIREFQRQGSTLLIVSHDKQAIQSICDRALLLKAGRVLMEASPENVMDYYSAILAEHQEQSLTQIVPAQGQVKTVSGTGEASIESIVLYDLSGRSLNIFHVGQRVRADIMVKINNSIDQLVVGFGIKDRLGQMMFGTNTYHTGQVLVTPQCGSCYQYEVEFLMNLGVGSYSVHASLVRNFSHIEKNYHWIDGAFVFEVVNKDKIEFVGCSWNEMTFKIVDCSARAMPVHNTEKCLSAGTSRGQLERRIVVLDVGCRWGFAEKFTSAASPFQVYGFDPDPQECQRLSQLYENPSISLVPVALAEAAGLRTLFITKEPACSSLFQPDPYLIENYPALECARQVSTVQIQTNTLDLWMLQNNIYYADYIKIDTQGSELEILKGGISTLKKVRCIEVEVEFNPIYLGQAVFSDVDHFLRSQGFVLWKLSNQVHYSSQGTGTTALGSNSIYYDDLQVVSHNIYPGQLYWANAHYVNREILSNSHRDPQDVAVDIELFNALGMSDVIDHLRGSVKTAPTQ